MAKDAAQTTQAEHPSVPKTPALHPAPTSTRLRPEQNPETEIGAAARIASILRQKPELDPGRPEKNDKDGKPRKAQREEPDEEQEVSESQDETEALQDSDAAEDGDVAQEARSESDEGNEGDAQPIELDAESLAEALGFDTNALEVGDDGEVFIKTKIDGKAGKATLRDLVKGYQTDASLSNRGKAIADREKALQSKLDEYEKATSQGHQVLAALIQSAQHALNPFANVDWKQLKEDDPAQYGVLRADFNDWQQRIGGITQQAIQHYQTSTEALSSERGKAEEEKIVKEVERLTKLIPDYSDELEGNIRRWAKDTYGVSDMPQVPNAWTIDAYRKAMLYDQGRAKIADKKVKKVARVLKPGARKSKQQVNHEGLMASRSQLAKSGKVDDAAAYFRELAKRRR